MADNKTPEQVLAQSFIGSLIGDEDKLPKISVPLEKGSFNGKLGVVYDAIYDLSRQQFAPTPERIVQWLEIRDDTKSVGITVEHLQTLQEHATGDIAFSANVLRQYMAQRDMERAANKQLELVTKNEGDLSDQYVEMQHLLDAAAPQLDGKQRRFTGPAAAEAYLVELAKRRDQIETGRKWVGFPTHWGLPDADLGFEDGWMILVSGKRGQGKTTVALELIEHNAPHALVCYIHLETSPMDIQQRMVIRRTGWSRRVLKKGLVDQDYSSAGGARISVEAIEEVVAETGEIMENVRFVHAPEQSPAYVMAILRHYKREADELGLPFLGIVDYFGKMTVKPKFKNSSGWEAQAEAASALKNCAEVLGFPLVVLSQESKSDKDDKRPAKTIELVNQAQVHLSIEREMADYAAYVGPQSTDEDGRPVGYRIVTESQREQQRVPVYTTGDGGLARWHNPNSWGCRATLRLAKQNEGPTGPTEVLFMGYRYILCGIGEHQEVIMPPGY